VIFCRASPDSGPDIGGMSTSESSNYAPKRQRAHSVKMLTERAISGPL
jgi:hypothetical protein